MMFVPAIATRKANGEPLIFCRHCGACDDLSVDIKENAVLCKECGRQSEINPKPPKPKAAPKKKRR